jgi:23S rRNA pseudouridine2605 synthase
VLGHLGLAVNRLIRVSFGPFQLGEIPDGGIEEVRTRTLREQLGERVAALAGADFSGPRIERAPPPRTPPRAAEVRAPQEDSQRKRPPQSRKRRRPDDRLGEPERARREKRRGRRPARGKPR